MKFKVQDKRKDQFFKARILLFNNSCHFVLIATSDFVIIAVKRYFFASVSLTQLLRLLWTLMFHIGRNVKIQSALYNTDLFINYKYKMTINCWKCFLNSNFYARKMREEVSQGMRRSTVFSFFRKLIREIYFLLKSTCFFKLSIAFYAIEIKVVINQ